MKLQKSSLIPALFASITAHSRIGLSKIVNISLGIDLVAGKNLVPSPATGKIALVSIHIK